MTAHRPPAASATRPARITMQDVARAAQVSQTAVSLVLNQRAGANIPPETRARIQAVAAQLGYRPNAMARALRQGNSSLLGLVTDEIATTPFAGDIVRGAQQAAWQQGRILTLVNTDHQSALEQEALSALLQHQIEAYLLASMAHRSLQLPALLRGHPVVLVNASSDDPDLPSVVPDELRGGREATTTLTVETPRSEAVVAGADQHLRLAQARCFAAQHQATHRVVELLAGLGVMGAIARRRKQAA